MSAGGRLTQARQSALVSIVEELSDEELVEALLELSPERALLIAECGRRAATLVARTVPSWSSEHRDGTLALWRTLSEFSDRGGINALVLSLPISTLLDALNEWVAWPLLWESLDARSAQCSDSEWLQLVIGGQVHAAQLLGAALARGETIRVGMALDSDILDGEALLAYLVRTRDLDSWLAGRLEGVFADLLVRFGERRGDLVELPMGDLVDGSVAHLLATSSHPGLRRVAARSARSDTLVRSRLLGDPDPSLDGALCEAPLNANELDRLMTRLRGRASAPAEASSLLFQPEPLSTKDRLWLLRAGQSDLTKSWVSGLSAQDPRGGEVALLVRSPGSAFVDDDGVEISLETVAHWARGTQWERELLSSL